MTVHKCKRCDYHGINEPCPVCTEKRNDRRWQAALAAMSVVIDFPDFFSDSGVILPKDFVRECFDVADAMIAEAERRESGDE